MTEKIIEVGLGAMNERAKAELDIQLKEKRQIEIEKMYAPRAPNLIPIIFALATVSVLVFGWRAGLDDYITAESGLGYWLGIVGGSMMLVMLLYSVRKRVKWMRRLGAIRHWFRLHMILGILGPVLIMFHCGFKLGSQNSNVALASMIIVAVSGVVGRYIYGKIHFGLYGSKVTLQQLQMDESIAGKELSRIFEDGSDWHRKLQKYHAMAGDEPGGLIRCFFRLLWLNIQTRYANNSAKRAVKKACKNMARQDCWGRRKYRKTFRTCNSYLKAYFITVRKIAGLDFFERLFAMWHILHIPLFVMLILTASFHIIAVHMY